MTSFIKAMRSEQASFLDNHPSANHLINVIARRARRTKCELNMLEVGECFVSFKSVGLSEQQYRTAKKQLRKWNLAEFKKGRKVTDKGTVALLMNSLVYDININDPTEEQRKSNGRVTTNKECKKEKNEKNIHQLIVDEYKKTFLGKLSMIEKLTDKRKSAINGCIKEMKGTQHDFSKIETWSKYFIYITGLAFLMGEKTDFKVNFDFLVKKSNMLKIVEGSYDNK